MSLRDLLRVLQRQWWIVVLVTALGLAVAAAVVVIAPAKYTADARLMVSMQASGTANELLQGITYTQARMSSYAGLAVSPLVIEGAIEELGLDESPREVAERVEAEVLDDSMILKISVTDSSPEAAADLANATARSLVDVIENQVEPRVTGSRPVVAVSIIQPAVPPLGPSSPILWLYLLVGGIGGLVLGVGMIFILNSLDTRVRDLNDIHRISDLPVLGAFNRSRTVREHPLVILDDPRGTHAEAYRALATNLDFFDIAKPRRVLIVTSTVPGEGKTTTVVNLAVAIAESGKRVIVVEADMRRPAASKYLGIEGAVGLSSVLTGRSALSDVVQSYAPGFDVSILPAGIIPPNPGELLHSDRTAALIARLRGEYDYVLIDTPPLLPVSDAVLLSRHADAVLYVMRAGGVKSESFTAAMASLGRVHADVLGIVATRLPSRGMSAYYYYENYSSIDVEPPPSGPVRSSRQESDDEQFLEQELSALDEPDEGVAPDVHDDAPVAVAAVGSSAAGATKTRRRRSER